VKDKEIIPVNFKRIFQYYRYMQNYLMNYCKRVKIMLTKREDRNIEEQENRKMKIERESV